MNKSQIIQSLKSQGFSNDILNAFKSVKRENFIPLNLRDKAYLDTALPIGRGQTISQPYTIATMLDMLNAKQANRVLEVGSGCGYVLSLLSEIVGPNGKVFGIEREKKLYEDSLINIKNLKNTRIYNKNGAFGLEEESPFDKIIISAGCKEIPLKLLNQLKNKALLVAPLGSRREQSLVCVQRNKDKFKIIKQIPGFVFVPFVNK